MKCRRCAEPATHMEPVTQEQAFLHDLLTGAGMYLDPVYGYVLPTCGTHD